MEESIVHLEKRNTGQAIAAELYDEITDEHLELWRSTWMPRVNEVIARLERQRIPRDESARFALEMGRENRVES